MSNNFMRHERGIIVEWMWYVQNEFWFYVAATGLIYLRVIMLSQETPTKLCIWTINGLAAFLSIGSYIWAFIYSGICADSYSVKEPWDNSNRTDTDPKPGDVCYNFWEYRLFDS